jgi:hypothetical protein
MLRKGKPTSFIVGGCPSRFQSAVLYIYYRYITASSGRCIEEEKIQRRLVGAHLVYL